MVSLQTNSIHQLSRHQGLPRRSAAKKDHFCHGDLVYGELQDVTRVQPISPSHDQNSRHSTLTKLLIVVTDTSCHRLRVGSVTTLLPVVECGMLTRTTTGRQTKPTPTKLLCFFSKLRSEAMLGSTIIPLILADSCPLCPFRSPLHYHFRFLRLVYPTSSNTLKQPTGEIRDARGWRCDVWLAFTPTCHINHANNHRNSNNHRDHHQQ